jgi:hypothetical protein
MGLSPGALHGLSLAQERRTRAAAAPRSRPGAARQEEPESNG